MSDTTPTPYNPQPPAPRPKTSGMAVASLVLGILWVLWIGSILSVIFGHLALRQTSRDPNVEGRGLAIAGLVLGYIGVGGLAFWIFIFGLAGASASAVGF